MLGNDDDLDASNAAVLRPTCVANTGDAFIGPVGFGQKKQGVNHADDHSETNFFQDAQWTADGTSVVSLNNDQSLRTFVLPPDLLDAVQQPHSLVPHTTLTSATKVQSYTTHPDFSLDDPSTTLILSSATDVPLRLTNAVHDSYVHATYSHVHPTTEAFIASHSLAFINDGTHFASGSQGLVSVFDVSRDGEGPVTKHRTKPKNPTEAATSMRDNGKIMALSVSSDGLLAAGGTNRKIGLFANQGHGACQTAFSVAGSPGDDVHHSGSGITSVAWTPDGHYVLAAERQSDGIHVYDVRTQLRRVAWLSGRRANTTQRLGIDIVPTATGCEVWAGGTDGHVRMWQNPGSLEGEQGPDADLDMHSDAVASAVWHHSGSVLATCSGQRHFDAKDDTDPSDDDSDSDSVDSESVTGQTGRLTQSRTMRTGEDTPIDNTLRIWTV